MKKRLFLLLYLIGLIPLMGINVTAVVAAPLSSQEWIEHEIRYYLQEAGEVWLVWGIDGWQTLPQEMRPAGTIIRDEVMHTPMHKKDNVFTVNLHIPAGTTIDYGFLITRGYDGTPIPATWESGTMPISTKGRVTEIRSLRTLPLGLVKSLETDMRFRWKAILALVTSFLLVIVGARKISDWSKRSGLLIFPQVGRRVIELILLSIGFKISLVLIAYLSLATFNLANPEFVLFESGKESIQRLLNVFTRGDVQWYMQIANSGYEHRAFSTAQHANWAFYPLWPLVLKVGNVLPFGMIFWGILVANVFSIAAIVGVYKLVLLDYEQETALLAAILTLSFPGAYFLMRPGPEALFLLLSVLTFYAGRKKQWVLAGLCGALATLTRLQGIMLLVPLIYQYFHFYQNGRQHDWKALAVPLIPAALLVHMTYLYFMTGNFFANFEIHAAWDHHQSYPFAAMVRFLDAPFMVDYYGWNLAPVSFIFVFCAVILTMIAIQCWRNGKYQGDLLLLLGFNLFVILARDNLEASLRYLGVVFPLMVVLALAVEQKRLLATLIVFIFIALQVFYLIGFSLGLNWATT